MDSQTFSKITRYLDWPPEHPLTLATELVCVAGMTQTQGARAYQVDQSQLSKKVKRVAMAAKALSAFTPTPITLTVADGRRQRKERPCD